MFTAIVTHAPTMPARVIRAIDGGEGSHIGLRMPSGGVWDVTLRHGVRYWTDERVWLAQHGRYVVARQPFAVPDPVASAQWIGQREGEGYDVWGALGIGLWTNMDTPGRWWCSELLIGFARAGGAQIGDGRKRVGVRLGLSWLRELTAS